MSLTSDWYFSSSLNNKYVSGHGIFLAFASSSGSLDRVYTVSEGGGLTYTDNRGSFTRLLKEVTACSNPYMILKIVDSNS